ncbi:MAG: response regulator [Candidatus Sulfobium sp.]
MSRLWRHKDRKGKAEASMKNKILIVDDDRLIRQLLSLILRSAGYSVVEAVNGEDALDKLKEIAIDLVITDLRMPGIDGIELTRELRMNPEYEYVPVIMLTSDFMGYKRREGEQAGVNGWISKPFIPQQLVRTIREFQSDREPGELACNQAS